MRDEPKIRPSKEPLSFRQRIKEDNHSQYKPSTVGEISHDADDGTGLDILSILDALPFYVLLIDEDHFILEANNAVKTQLGVKPKDIIGKYCPKVIHDLDGPFPGCPLEEAVEAGHGIEREFFDEKTGHWINSAIYPTKEWTQDNKRIYFHMVTDITRIGKRGRKKEASQGSTR
jgi:PAS domain S-box-containing protein